MPLDILLVQSDAALNRQIREALRDAGARVASFDCGKAALSSYSRARFDGVVVAPRLADLDAWRFVRMIRSARFGFPAVPIVITCERHEQRSYSPLVGDDTHLLPLEDVPSSFAKRVLELVEQRPRPSLLLVEDDPSAGAAALRVLEKYFSVELAEDGPTAITAWTARRHELVVLDLMLPGLSGEEVQRAILQENPHQPVIILTALDDPLRCEALMLAGAAEFVGKATNLAAFATQCIQVLQHARYASAAENAIQNSERLEIISERVKAANARLQRGQTKAASQQLSHAIALSPSGDISDDTWVRVLSDFPPDR